MEDPYKVLGVKENASNSEIKKAYRELVKKYHPDQYRDNPLSKLAEEKLREINEAYDYIIKNKSDGYRNDNKSGFDDTDYSSSSKSSFSQVRIHINRGELHRAEAMLNSSGIKNAEWHYLKGLIYLKKGYFNEARNHISRAVSMEPANFEYKNALNRMRYNNNTYRNNAYGRGYTNQDDLCRMCQCLWCSDCCCECMGGDLISCC